MSSSTGTNVIVDVENIDSNVATKGLTLGKRKRTSKTTKKDDLTNEQIDEAVAVLTAQHSRENQSSKRFPTLNTLVKKYEMSYHRILRVLHLNGHHEITSRYMTLGPEITDKEEKPAKRGRKAGLTDDQKQQIRNQAREKDLCCNSYTSSQLRNEIQVISEKDLKPSTLFKFLKEIAPESVKSKVKPHGRSDAIKDLYSCLSHAVISFAIQGVPLEHSVRDYRIKPDFYWNLDGVTSLISSGERETIRLVKGSSQFLRDFNLSPSSSRKKEKERAIHQIYVTNASGYLVAAINIIKDNNIKDIQFHCLDKGTGGYELWAILIPNKTVLSEHELRLRHSSNDIVQSNLNESNAEAAVEVEEDDDNLEFSPEEETTDEAIADSFKNIEVQYMAVIFHRILLPLIEKYQRKAYQENESFNFSPISAAQFNELTSSAPTIPNANSSSNSNGSSNSSSEPDERNRSANHSQLSNEIRGLFSSYYDIPVCLCLDGDFPQIEALYASVLNSEQLRSVDFQKFPAQLSLTYQPNDVSKAFMVLHKLVKTYNPEKREKTLPSWFYPLEDILKKNKIDKASRSCFLNFFKNIRTIISQSFTVKIVSDGWQNSGLYPLNHLQILSRCSTYQSLTTESKAQVESGLVDLIEESKFTGVVNEQRLHDLLGTIYQSPTNPTDLPINQQRGLWLNKGGVLEMRRKDEQKRLEALAKKQAAAQRANQRREDVAAMLLTTPFAEFPPESVTHLQVRCHASNCFARRCIVDDGEDDFWRGCCFCQIWFCNKEKCQTSAVAHIKSCKRKVDEFNLLHNNSR